MNTGLKRVANEFSTTNSETVNMSAPSLKNIKDVNGIYGASESSNDFTSVKNKNPISNNVIDDDYFKNIFLDILNDQQTLLVLK